MTCRFCMRQKVLHNMMINIYSQGKSCEAEIDQWDAHEMNRRRTAAGDAVRYLIYFLEELGSSTCDECASAHRYHFPTTDKKP